VKQCKRWIKLTAPRRRRGECRMSHRTAPQSAAPGAPAGVRLRSKPGSNHEEHKDLLRYRHRPKRMTVCGEMPGPSSGSRKTCRAGNGLPEDQRRPATKTPRGTRQARSRAATPPAVDHSSFRISSQRQTCHRQRHAKNMRSAWSQRGQAQAARCDGSSAITKPAMEGSRGTRRAP